MPCGAQNEDITHTCTHTHLKACKHTLNTLMHNKMFFTWALSSTQKQPHSISFLYILQHRMETEIKLNKTLGAEAGLV